MSAVNVVMRRMPINPMMYVNEAGRLKFFPSVQYLLIDEGAAHTVCAWMLRPLAKIAGPCDLQPDRVAVSSSPSLAQLISG
jgi:hypothetical protein